DQRAALAAFYLKEKISGELAMLPRPSLVYAAASDFEPDGGLKPAGAPRPVHRLRRGDINKPLEAASPGALECVSGLEAKFDLGDAGNEGPPPPPLPQWLAHPETRLRCRSSLNPVCTH